MKNRITKKMLRRVAAAAWRKCMEAFVTNAPGPRPRGQDALPRCLDGKPSSWRRTDTERFPSLFGNPGQRKTQPL